MKAQKLFYEKSTVIYLQSITDVVNKVKSKNYFSNSFENLPLTIYHTKSQTAIITNFNRFC